MRKPHLPLSVLTLGSLLALAPGSSDAATAQVDASYFSDFVTNPITDNSGVALTAGSTVNGDGAVIQIGYLAGVSTVADPSGFGATEWGTFVPLSGDGLNSAAGFSSIGDVDSGAGGPLGFFGISVIFGDGNNSDPLSSNLPGAYPQRLAIRFYNGTTVAGSTHFTTVSSSNSEWLLNTPVAVPVPGGESTLDMDGHSLAWQGTAFRTDQLLSAPSGPEVVGFVPADGSSNAAIGSNLVLTFDQNVVKGTGNLLIKRLGDNSVAQMIDVTSGAVTISNDTVTINPADLSFNIGYYVEIAAGALAAEGGPAFNGIADNSTWSFTTMRSTYDGTDNDGLPAIFEDAFGLSPLVADNIPLTVTDGSSFSRGTQITAVDYSAGLKFSAQYVRRTDGRYNYAVQFSHDLSNWETSNVTPEVVSSDSSGFEVVEVPYIIFLSNGQKAKFFRIVLSES